MKVTITLTEALGYAKTGIQDHFNLPSNVEVEVIGTSSVTLPPSVPIDDPEEIRCLPRYIQRNFNRETKIQAIKHVREQTERHFGKAVSLAYAKYFVERILDGNYEMINACDSFRRLPRFIFTPNSNITMFNT